MPPSPPPLSALSERRPPPKDPPPLPLLLAEYRPVCYTTPPLYPLASPSSYHPPLTDAPSPPLPCATCYTLPSVVVYHTPLFPLPSLSPSNNGRTTPPPLPLICCHRVWPYTTRCGRRDHDDEGCGRSFAAFWGLCDGLPRVPETKRLGCSSRVPGALARRIPLTGIRRKAMQNRRFVPTRSNGLRGRSNEWHGVCWYTLEIGHMSVWGIGRSG